MKRELNQDDVFCAGHVPNLELKDMMSCSHVMVLASVQEGLAMVMAEALACGCPVIATENTGARDLFEDGREGFIVPIRNSKAIQEKLEYFADNPAVRERMSTAAVESMRSMGGWRRYGEAYLALLAELVSAH